MTNEDLVRLYQEGCSNALEELLEKNKGMVYKVANKFYTGGINSLDVEDLIQEGNIGLIIAAKKYDLYNENKASFATYAFYWIYQKMNSYIRNSDTNEEVSLNKPITIKDDVVEMQDTLADGEDHYDETERMLDNAMMREDIDKSLLDISLYKRNVVRLRYGLDCEPCTRDEIADILSSSSDSVRNAESQALRRLSRSRHLIKYKSALEYDNALRKEELQERQLNNGKYLYV